VGFCFGDRKVSSRASKPVQSGWPVGEIWLMELEIVAQVGDLDSPIADVREITTTET
jgi:hypothetical protein